MTAAPDFNLLDDETERPPRRGFSPGSAVVLVGILVMAAVVGLALARQKQTQPSAGAAPEFTLTTFDGDTLSLSDLRGQVVVLNFWASWCRPCYEEAPLLQSVWERYQDRGVVIVGVAYADVEGSSRAFIDQFGLTFPNGPDSQTRISDAYNISGVPETFIIDQEGNIARFIYAPVQEAELTETLDRLLEAA